MTHLYIPTFRRAYEQVTYDQLPAEWREHVTFVVDEKDASVLRRRYASHGCSVVVHPTDVRTIAQKRAWIMRTSPHRRIVMLDDDLRIFVRRGPDTVKLRKAEPDDVRLHLRELCSNLYSYAHAGWSARQGNNRQPHGWVRNTRMMYTLGYDLEVVREVCELGRIEHREDMDYTLQLLRAGYCNAVDFRVAVDQRYNARGGASLERTVEASNADAERLAELHPGLVRVTEKQYKASLPRKEVVCSWKKALGAG